MLGLSWCSGLEGLDLRHVVQIVEGGRVERWVEKRRERGGGDEGERQTRHSWYASYLSSVRLVVKMRMIRVICMQ